MTLLELKKALEANFGYSDEIQPAKCNTKTPDTMSEADIYEAVKKILTNTGSIDIATLENKLTSQLSNNSCASAKCCGEETGRFATIRKILQTTETFGNDIDEVDDIARRCGKIYCDEVDKYMNPRGGQFQAGIYPVSANVLSAKIGRASCRERV